MMDFLTFLNNSIFFDICVLTTGSYLVLMLCFGIRFSSASELAYPNLSPCFSLFSVFFIFATIWLLCFDFDHVDSLFFFNQNIQFFLLFVACCVCFASRDFLNSLPMAKFEYDILFLFVVFSAICLCFTDDFLVMYLAIELQSLAFYVFASLNRNSEYSTESGLKYFLFGAVISCFLLLGFSFIYLSYGFTSFETLFSIAVSDNNNFLILGILFILFALLFKVGAAPFHFWLCDVYEGATLSVTFLFAALPKIVLFSLLMKIFLFSLIDLSNVWSIIFLSAGLCSIAIGSISALFQKRIKRLFAYSTIAHTGFILFSFVIATPDSAKALVFYVMIYSLLTILLFSFLVYSTKSSSVYPKYLANWTSIGKNNAIFAFTFTIILFSIAGIPPLAGFFSKFFILSSIVANEFYLSGILIIILSSIACFYYIRLIKIIFFSNKDYRITLWLSCSNRQNTEILIAILLLFNTFFFLVPNLFSNISIVLGLTLL